MIFRVCDFSLAFEKQQILFDICHVCRELQMPSAADLIGKGTFFLDDLDSDPE